MARKSHVVTGKDVNEVIPVVVVRFVVERFRAQDVINVVDDGLNRQVTLS